VYRERMTGHLNVEGRSGACLLSSAAARAVAVASIDCTDEDDCPYDSSAVRFLPPPVSSSMAVFDSNGGVVLIASVGVDVPEDEDGIIDDDVIVGIFKLPMPPQMLLLLLLSE